MKNNFVQKQNEILFLMPIRNRRTNAIKSIKSIVASGLGKNFDFLIIQDYDKDNLSIDDFDKKIFNDQTIGKIKIINVKIGGVFYKTKLLNFGIKSTKNKFIVQQDADILFEKSFLERLIVLCSNEENFLLQYFAAPYYETDCMIEPALNFQDKIRGKNDLVSHTHILYRPQVEAVRGYDERMRIWREEKDLYQRISGKFRLKGCDMGEFGIKNMHLTHSNKLRSGDAGMDLKNKLIKNENASLKQFVSNPNGWGRITKKQIISIEEN